MSIMQACVLQLRENDCNTFLLTAVFLLHFPQKISAGHPSHMQQGNVQPWCQAQGRAGLGLRGLRPALDLPWTWACGNGLGCPGRTQQAYEHEPGSF